MYEFCSFIITIYKLAILTLFPYQERGFLLTANNQNNGLYSLSRNKSYLQIS